MRSRHRWAGTVGWCHPARASCYCPESPAHGHRRNDPASENTTPGPPTRQGRERTADRRVAPDPPLEDFFLTWQRYLLSCQGSPSRHSLLRPALQANGVPFPYCGRTQVSDNARPAVLLMRLPRCSGNGCPVATLPFRVSWARRAGTKTLDHPSGLSGTLPGGTLMIKGSPKSYQVSARCSVSVSMVSVQKD